MIRGIGIDLVDIRRITEIHAKYGERFEQRMLSSDEIDRLPVPLPARRRRLASAYAAKEALAKALGSGIRGIVSLRSIELMHEPSGMPKLRFSNQLTKQLANEGVVASHLTVSNEGDMTVACAVLEKGECAE